MKNNKGFTLIELLAVIVVLAIVMVLATTTVLPYMSDAREEAFRLEATNVITSASSALDLYELGQVNLNGNESCKVDNTVCFTVKELINLGIYEGNSKEYFGSVYIDITDEKQPTYTLYFKKNDEFKIIGGTHKNYKDSGDVQNLGAWSEDYEKCNCSTSNN